MTQLFIFFKHLSLHIKTCRVNRQQQSAISRLFQLVLPGLCLCAALIGCAQYKIPTECFASEDAGPNDIEQLSSRHWLYQFVPRHRTQIQWYDIGHTVTWMLFGNDDDGIFGEGPCAHYRPGQLPSFGKAVCWGVRNPLHNFCFYVIGSAERRNSEIDLLRIVPGRFSGFDYRHQGETVFASEGTSFYLGMHGGKPFVSFRLAYSPAYRLDFYCGWRCRGNFGLKFLPFKTSI